MDVQRLGDLVAGPTAWIEHLQRGLEGKLEAAPQRSARRRVIPVDGRPVQPDIASASIDQSEDRLGNGALAATAFSDQGEGFPASRYFAKAGG